MAGEEPPRPGIIASLRRLCDTVLALVHNRVELFAAELEEQKVRLVRLLVLAAVTVFLGNTAVLMITAAILILVGDGLRVPVVIGLCLIYVTAAIAAFLVLRKELRGAPPPFKGTVAELKKDRDWLKPGN